LKRLAIILLALDMAAVLASCSIFRESETYSPVVHYDTGRININVADVRAEPRNRSERVSQALFYETVEVTGGTERFFKIVQQDGYQGWVKREFVSEHDGFVGQGPYTVSENLAAAYEKPDRSSRRITSIPYGCRLYGIESDGYLKTDSNRYGPIFVSLEDCIRPEILGNDIGIDSATIAGEAEKFLGAPYLWGGRSFFGIDCSGFVQTILKRFGISIPRDTKDQIKVGTEIRREDVRTGDLLFFPRHVTLALSKDLMIHSTPSNGGVAYNSLDPKSPIYSRYHDQSFITARRVSR
jgi:hypothetical protein